MPDFSGTRQATLAPSLGFILAQYHDPASAIGVIPPVVAMPGAVANLPVAVAATFAIICRC